MSRPEPDTAEVLNLHATSVAWQSTGVLIMGPSGAGKSGLALQMMGLGAVLVADDRVRVIRRAGCLVASAPPTLAGVIEVRGLGLLRAEPVAEAAIALVVDLGQPATARMPHPQSIRLLDLEIELILGGGAPNLALGLVQMLRLGRAV